MIDNSLARLLSDKQVLTWSRQLIDDLTVRLRALTRVSVSSNDSTFKYLEEKLVAGTNVTFDIVNEGGDEQLRINSSGGGGGGTVTSVQGGVAITGNYPADTPITTSGTLDLDIDPLTLQTAIHHTDDMFIFLDASVSSTPTGVRKGNVHGIEAAMTFTHLGNPAHELASTTGVGAEHTVAGLTSGQVLQATGATSARFQSIVLTDADIPNTITLDNITQITTRLHSSLQGIGANDHHNQSHVLATTTAIGPDHTVSGLTTGQLLRAISATDVAFGTVNLLSASHGDTLADSVIRGDLIVGNITPRWARLPKGTANNTLTMDSTGDDPEWNIQNLLSATHPDTVTGTVVEGDLIVGNSTPKWERFAKGAALEVLRVDATGTFLEWAAAGSGGTLGFVQESGVNIETDVTTLNFIESASVGADVISSPSAGVIDVDLDSYCYLAGRSGTTNNILISTSGGTGTITGSLGAGDLVLSASAAPMVTGSQVHVQGQFTVGADATKYPSAFGNYDWITIGVTQTMPPGDSPVLRAVSLVGTYTTDTGLTSMQLFRSAATYATTNSSSTTFGACAIFVGGFTVTPGTSADITGTSMDTLRANLVLNNATATCTWPTETGLLMTGTIGNNWDVDDWRAIKMSVPTGAGGSGSALRLGGVELDDLVDARFTNTYTIWSKGEMPMCHQGPGHFGSNQSTITPPAASTTLELTGTTEALLLNRATIAGIGTPANGHLFYDTGTSKVTAREGGAWVTFQPLDTDLTEIAALANAQGNILYTNSTNNWTTLGPGSANTCLRSTGTDVAFSSGVLDNNAKVAVNKNSGATVGTRRRINFIEGTNVTLTIADDAGNEEVDVTIASTASGGGPTFATDVVTGSTTVISNAGDTTLNTVTTTPGSGVDVCFIASVTWDVTGSTEKEVVLKLFKDGSEVNSADRYTMYHLAAVAAKTEETMTAHWVIASEAAGSHTYTLRATETVASANDARRLVSRLTVAY